MIREAIAKLTKKEDLTYEEARGVMEEMMDGTATQAQMGGLLMALSMQGETIDEITAFAEVMREKGVKIKPEREVIDIVGLYMGVQRHLRLRPGKIYLQRALRLQTLR